PGEPASVLPLLSEAEQHQILREWSDNAAVEQGGESRPYSVPIGRPNAIRAYVLDECFDPVPVGLWGELYLGGDGPARGDLDRLEPTAERFVPDAFGEKGGRLYRTGNRVRWRADGIPQPRGRAANPMKMKMRGFRSELGEIEASPLA